MSVDDRTTTSTVAKGRKSRWRRRKPLKRVAVVVHRWTSLLLGLVLLMITTSGAAVVYTPEWTMWTNSSVFAVTAASDPASNDPISFAQAIAVVETAHPSFEAGSVNVYRGLYEIYSSDDEAHPGFYGVDPGTGKITGQVNPDRGVMAFMNQVHECFFTCDSYPGYVKVLNDPVPTLGMGWLKDLTYGGVILGLAALMLLFLGLSGIWLWWPTLKRWRHGFRVRWRKGRYVRDYDLHQVVGMAAVPFLLIWGLTGASFEFNWVSTAWYFSTGGQTPPEESFTSNSVKDANTPDVGLDAAIVAADRKAGPGTELVYASLPTKDDLTSTYSFWYAKGFDQYGHGAYPGNYSVSVDRHDASRLQVDDESTAPTLSNRLLDNWGAPMFHYGQSVNGWWRLPWFLFGLTPLLLAATGVSTWLAKRAVRKRRRQYSEPTSMVVA